MRALSKEPEGRQSDAGEFSREIHQLRDALIHVRRPKDDLELERMRTAGQLKDDDGYRQLFTAYTKIKDKEPQTIAVWRLCLARAGSFRSRRIADISLLACACITSSAAKGRRCSCCTATAA